MATINNRQCPSLLINPLGYLMFFQWISMEFQWDPLDFPNQIQQVKSKVVVDLGEIQEIPSKVLLTFWGGY